MSTLALLIHPLPLQYPICKSLPAFPIDANTISSVFEFADKSKFVASSKKVGGVLTAPQVQVGVPPVHTRYLTPLVPFLPALFPQTNITSPDNDSYSKSNASTSVAAEALSKVISDTLLGSFPQAPPVQIILDKSSAASLQAN